MELNEYQKAAVLDESPVCLVRANVGSGKTTVLIEKIRYFHEKKGVPLERMTILTFTKSFRWRSWAMRKNLKSAFRRRNFSWQNS